MDKIIFSCFHELAVECDCVLSFNCFIKPIGYRKDRWEWD